MPKMLRAWLAAFDAAIIDRGEEPLLKFARELIETESSLSSVSPMALQLLRREQAHRHSLATRRQWLRFVVALASMGTFVFAQAQRHDDGCDSACAAFKAREEAAIPKGARAAQGLGHDQHPARVADVCALDTRP